MVQWDSHSYMIYREVNGRVVTRRGQQLLKLFVTQTYTMPKRKHDGTKTKADRAKNGTADAPAAAAAAEGGQKERYTFFFTAASPFSQWHPCEFTVDGVKYTCAEQFMMHQKAGNCWLVNCRWSEFILQGVVMGLESRKLGHSHDESPGGGGGGGGGALGQVSYGGVQLWGPNPYPILGKTGLRKHTLF